jgi:transcriptional regulator with XRE-family HTH domain
MADSLASSAQNPLGAFLRGRRERLDPAALGLPALRRRTPGLRREEVADRAHVSATWYTWLEQGRGGAPSADALDRIARALLLSDAEREHLYLIALGRPPAARYRAPEPVAPHLQRVLDALEYSPAYLRTPTWDIVAWNRAAAAVLTDYAQVPPHERNLLRLFFLRPRVREAQEEWLKVARFLVAAFRADVARVGALAAVQDFVADLAAASPEFAAIWRENEVRGAAAQIAKRLRHPQAGWLDLDYQVFAVAGRPDLDMVTLTAATPPTAERIRALLA